MPSYPRRSASWASDASHQASLPSPCLDWVVFMPSERRTCQMQEAVRLLYKKEESELQILGGKKTAPSDLFTCHPVWGTFCHLA